jgi:hypothetical protein
VLYLSLEQGSYLVEIPSSGETGITMNGKVFRFPLGCGLILLELLIAFSVAGRLPIPIIEALFLQKE